MNPEITESSDTGQRRFLEGSKWLLAVVVTIYKHQEVISFMSFWGRGLKKMSLHRLSNNPPSPCVLSIFEFYLVKMASFHMSRNCGIILNDGFFILFSLDS